MYPVEGRHKILQERVQNAEQIRAPAINFRPQVQPGVVVDFIPRSDLGYALKVLPFVPKIVTDAGEITFNDGNSNVPADADVKQFIPVYPIDAAPDVVQNFYHIGQEIHYVPYWGSGQFANVRGSMVCADARRGFW